MVTKMCADPCLLFLILWMEKAPFLKMYSSYVKTYTTALAHIADCMKSNERFADFIRVGIDNDNFSILVFVMLTKNYPMVYLHPTRQWSTSPNVKASVSNPI